MKSFPFDAVITAIDESGYPILDRTFGTDDWRSIVKRLISNGIFMDTDSSFHATAGDGMKVVVSPGTCIIDGTVGDEPNNRELSFQASSSQDRIDTVVLRWNDTREVRSIDLYVKTGVDSDVPVRPTLTRNESIYELGLCDIFITKNSTAISQAKITDTRLETERCGLCLPFATVDTTSLYSQIQAAITEKIAEIDALEDFTYLKGGFYAVDIEDGNMYAYYDEGENPPPLSIVNGRLKYTVNENNVLDIGAVTGNLGAGFITQYSGATAPTGWLLCDGSQISREEYSELFSVIGTSYGDGDGFTTFNLPNLSGKFALGSSTTHSLGETGGEEAVTLNVSQMPAHNHFGAPLEDAAYTNTATNTLWWQQHYGSQRSTTSVSGGGQPHNNMPPYVTINYIISTGTQV